MTLMDAITKLGSWDDEYTIYAVRVDGNWSPESVARVEAPLDDGRVVQKFDGTEMEYFLEVFLANEVLEDWQEISGERVLDDNEKYRVLAHYAEHDVWPAA